MSATSFTCPSNDDVPPSFVQAVVLAVYVRLLASVQRA
jgi:hypothetical protein